MAIYETYAQVYDQSGQIQFSILMLDYLNRLLPPLSLTDARPSPGRGGEGGEVAACDLCCGTGTVAIAFAARGWRVYGVDGSAAMLAEAWRKATEMGFKVEFSQQDMREFVLPQPMDLVTCFYDSVNYLLTVDDLLCCFQRVATALVPGGWFVFDMNTPAAFATNWNNTTFVIDQADFSIIMRNTYDAQTSLAKCMVTMFQRQGELYAKSVEEHIERAYATSEVADTLAQAGLELTARYKCFTFEEPTEETRRIMYVAQKR
jgi:SAM-dependent methyltransferase